MNASLAYTLDMKYLMKTISLFTSITVLMMVLFALICPELSMARTNDHSDCGAINMAHISESNAEGCLGLHLNRSENNPAILPDLSFLLSVISVVIVIFLKLFAKSLLIINLTHIYSRWRYFENIYKDFRASFLEKFAIWSYLITKPLVAEIV